MQGNLSRRDLGYTIYSRVEECIRGFISPLVEMHWDERTNWVPEGVLTQAAIRNGSPDFESADEFLEYTDFSDLQRIICFKNHFRDFIAHGSMQASDFCTVMDEIYGLRLKIAHVRGSFTIFDSDRLIACARRLAAELDGLGSCIAEFLNDLQERPEKMIVSIPMTFYESSENTWPIPNNLPSGDYDSEGGFVGRCDDIKKIRRLLEGNLHRVVSITGAGGVGKTALALRVVEEMLESGTSPFEGIVWVSAKENRLSHLGIEQVEPSLQSYEQLLDTVVVVMGMGEPSDTLPKKESDVQTIFSLFNNILIVIDNWETITDARIVDFVLDPPERAKILITSRRGLGQVERRQELRELSEGDAVELFRRVAREKGLDFLVSLPAEVVTRYVKRVSCFPLAVKWVLGQVALGADISAVVDRVNSASSDISRFCFEQVYDGISLAAKRILGALSCFDDPTVPGVLMYVADVQEDAFDAGVQELILASLIVPDRSIGDASQLVTKFGILALTRAFVLQRLDEEPSFRDEVQSRLATCRSNTEEAARVQRQYRYSLSYLNPTTDEERVAAMCAKTAWEKFSTGDYKGAVKDFQRGCRIAPHYGQILRNWAVVEFQMGHLVEANRLFEGASVLCPKDELIWLKWGEYMKQCNRVEDAVRIYERARDLNADNNQVLNALGGLYARLSRFEDGNAMLQAALTLDGQHSSIQAEKIDRSCRSDLLRRWAEKLRDTGDVARAEEKYGEALSEIELAWQLDHSDMKTLEIKAQILVNMGFLYRDCQRVDEAIRYFELAMGIPLATARTTSTLFRAFQQLVRLGHRVGHFGNLSRSANLDWLTRAAKNNPKVRVGEDYVALLQIMRLGEAVSGHVLSVDEHGAYCILSYDGDLSRTCLAHKTSFADIGKVLPESMVGAHVSFLPYAYDHEGVTKHKSFSTVVVDD